MWVICTGFEWIACKKWAIHSKNVYSLYVFDSFPPFLCPRVNRSCPSSLIFSFLKSDLSDSLLSLFTKEWPWVISSDCSWKKRDNERFTQVAHVKRATGANRSFAHKKRVNRLKNRWANSQPWFVYLPPQVWQQDTGLCPKSCLLQ